MSRSESSRDAASTHLERPPVLPNFLPALRSRRRVTAMTCLIALPTRRNNVGSRVLAAFTARDEVLRRAKKLLGLARREFPLPTEFDGFAFKHWKLAVVAAAILLLKRKRSQTRNGFTHKCLGVERNQKISRSPPMGVNQAPSGEYRQGKTPSSEGITAAALYTAITSAVTMARRTWDITSVELRPDGKLLAVGNTRADLFAVSRIIGRRRR